MKQTQALFILLLFFFELAAQDSKLSVGIHYGVYQYKGGIRSGSTYNPVPSTWGTTVSIDATYNLSKRIGLSLAGGYYTHQLNTTAINNTFNNMVYQPAMYQTAEQSNTALNMFTVLVGPSFSVGKSIKVSVIPYVGLCVQRGATYAVDYTYAPQNTTRKLSYSVDPTTNFILQPTVTVGYHLMRHWRIGASASVSMLNKSFGTYYENGQVAPITPANTFGSSDVLTMQVGLAYRL